MKNGIESILYILIAVSLCTMLVSCGALADENTLWDNAVYTEDSEFGTGSKLILVEVKAEEKSVTFKINTEKETVGDALVEHNLVSGEQGPYGLYIKVANGIEADYNKTKSYWAFCKNGESLMNGVDGEAVENGAHYELVYTKY